MLRKARFFREESGSRESRLEVVAFALGFESRLLKQADVGVDLAGHILSLAYLQDVYQPLVFA